MVTPLGCWQALPASCLPIALELNPEPSLTCRTPWPTHPPACPPFLAALQ